jgi:hypothetical protein
MVKDLANIKILTGLLEEEYERVRKPPREKKVETDGATEEGANGSVPQEDTIMAEPPQRTDSDAEDEPREKSGDVVERRIKKIMAELRESGTVDPDDEQEFDRRRVSCRLHPPFATFQSRTERWTCVCLLFLGCDFTRLVHFLSSSSV